MGFFYDAATALLKHGLSIKFSQRFSWTGVKNMRDRNELVDAILTAYDNASYAPEYQDGKLVRTYCNLAANEIAQKLGCHDLWNEAQKRPKTADEIYDFMASHSDPKKTDEFLWQEFQVSTLQPEFREVNFQAIQFWANGGYLVFAVQSSYNIGSSHGHIAIVRPGTMKTSGKWGKVPACMNIGGENFIALGKNGPMKGQPVGINEAFREIPRFFAWRGV